MSESTLIDAQPDARHEAQGQTSRRDELVLRLNSAAWIVAAFAFAIGVLVGLAID
jgi:hypothetical protein